MIKDNSRFPEDKLKDLDVITEIEDKNIIEYDGFICQLIDGDKNDSYYDIYSLEEWEKGEEDRYPDWSAETLDDAKFWIDGYNMSNLNDVDTTNYDTISFDDFDFETTDYDDDFIMEDKEINYWKSKFKLDD